MRNLPASALSAVVLALTLAAAPPCLAGGSPLVGLWADETGKVVYQFTRSGEFRHHRKLGETPPLPGETASGRPIVSWATTKGSYKSGKKACTIGKKRGDLLLLGDDFQGCYQARFAGEKLYLAEVYARGEGDPGLASTQMLGRIYELPRGIREE